MGVQSALTGDPRLLLQGYVKRMFGDALFVFSLSPQFGSSVQLLLLLLLIGSSLIRMCSDGALLLYGCGLDGCSY